MSLVEKRAMYMAKLQELISTRQKDIDEKVAAKRLEFENDVIVPYRAQLEQTQATEEMTMLVDFVNDIDKMLAYENGTQPEVEVESVEEAVETVQDEPEAEACEINEVETIDETFRTTEDEEIINDEKQEMPETVADERVSDNTDTSLDALVADLADTKAKLESAGQGRAGMPGIILPRR